MEKIMKQNYELVLAKAAATCDGVIKLRECSPSVLLSDVLDSESPLPYDIKDNIWHELFGHVYAISGVKRYCKTTSSSLT